MNDLLKYPVILESHYYGLNNIAIKYTTRNICSSATAQTLEEISNILFPNEEIEIYVLPAQNGCHMDRFWIKTKENPLATGLLIAFFGAILVAPSHISQIVTDASTRRLNESQIQINQSQDKLNKLQIEKLKKVMDEKMPEIIVTTEQCREIIESLEIKKNRNKHFVQLQADTEIKKEKFVAKSNNIVFSEKTIDDIDFDKYIEPIVKEEGFINLEVEGIIELLGPVLKQRKEGGGIKWKGIYYGDDIKYNEIQVFVDGESINFYMQDIDFKSKIADQDIVFASGDNIAVKMKITFRLSDSALSRKTVYIEEVLRHNKDIIEHKAKVTKNDIILNKQSSLF